MDERDERHEAERDRRMKLEEEHGEYRKELEEKTWRMNELNRLLEELESEAVEERAAREELNAEYRQLEDILKELDQEVRAIPYPKPRLKRDWRRIGRSCGRRKREAGRRTRLTVRRRRTWIGLLKRLES